MQSPESTAQDFKRLAARGVAVVTMRQLVVQSANILGGIFLMRLLSAEEFGLYAVLVFASQAMILLGGSALALQVVRSPIPLQAIGLRVLFTAQLAFSAVLAIGVWGAAPLVAGFVHNGGQAVLCVRIVSVAVLLSCLQVIPTALLERDLQFDRLAVAEIIQALTFNAVAVGMAWMGHGVLGVAYGLMFRGLVGAILVNLIRRWPMGLVVDFGVLRSEIGSGAAYLASSLTSLVKDAVNPLFVGSLLGAADVGLVSWATVVSSYCLLALMMLKRLYIPAFSRMASHPDQLGPFVTNILKLTNATAAPVACLIVMLIRPITAHIFGAKWLEALPAFYLFWGANLVVPTVTPLLSLLQALDRGRFVLYLTLTWMILTWGFSVPAVLILGITGAGLANLLVQFTSYLVFRAVARHVRLEILKSVLPYWIAAAVAGALAYAMQLIWPARDAPQVIAYMMAGAAIYVCLLIVIRKDDVRAALALVRQSARLQAS